MCIDQSRSDIFVAQKFLDRSDIVTAFEQVSSEGLKVWQVARFINPAFMPASLTAFWIKDSSM